MSLLKCKCDKLNESIYLNDTSFNLMKDLTKIELDSENWMKLHKCNKCNQLWSIDVWDNYTYRDSYSQIIATKIYDKNDWSEISKTKRKELILKHKGGTSDKACIMAGCSQAAVNGVAHCIDHLYDLGIRK